eukprot:m.114347 g.114347  ORF g.114347 m.114347 type:complete len:315 (+) comp16025_c0_seq2:1635-2579(+)
MEKSPGSVTSSVQQQLLKCFSFSIRYVRTTTNKCKPEREKDHTNHNMGVKKGATEHCKSMRVIHIVFGGARQSKLLHSTQERQHFITPTLTHQHPLTNTHTPTPTPTHQHTPTPSPPSFPVFFSFSEVVVVADAVERGVRARAAEVVVHALELVDVDVDSLQVAVALGLALKGVAAVQDAPVVEAEDLPRLHAELQSNALVLRTEELAEGNDRLVVLVHLLKGDAALRGMEWRRPGEADDLLLVVEHDVRASSHHVDGQLPIVVHLLEVRRDADEGIKVLRVHLAEALGSSQAVQQRRLAASDLIVEAEAVQQL